jgi:hypothetical protein
MGMFGTLVELMGKCVPVLQYDVSSKIIRHFGAQLWTIITLQSIQTKATAAVSATACFDAMFAFN